MKADSKLTQLLLVSPWTLLVFLIIPSLVTLSITLHVHLPVVGSTTPLLINNICFAFFVFCRLFHYLAGINKSLRYGAARSCRSSKSITLSSPIDEVQVQLKKAGYSFDTDGYYCERRDTGYVGTTIMYAGLLLLLSVGCWDNLQQFSGVLLDGMGSATNLNKVDSYLRINKGPFADTLATLPKMQILRQTLPDGMYPKGATEIALTGQSGKTHIFKLVPGTPISYGAFDISMTKLVFQPQIVIKYRDSLTIFNELVTLNPLIQKRGVYSFYGLFQGAILGGGVYYQPEKNTLMVVITEGNKKVVTDLVFQVDQQVTQGDYILSCSKMGQWSEIQVTHRRHKGLLIIGVIIAVIGLLLRLAVRPQRIWLKETAEGCTVWPQSKEAISRLHEYRLKK